MFGRIFYFMGQKNNAKKGIAEFIMGCLPDTFDLGNTSLPQVKKKKKILVKQPISHSSIHQPTTHVLIFFCMILRCFLHSV